MDGNETLLCGAPVIGRDGKPLGFDCNLDKGHLDKCCQTTRDALAFFDEPGGPGSRFSDVPGFADGIEAAK